LLLPEEGKMKALNSSSEIRAKSFKFLGPALLLLCFFSSPAFSSSANPQSSQLLGPRDKSGDWVKHAVNGIPYEVALDIPSGKEGTLLSRRLMFVYLDIKYYTRANVLAVFSDISSKVSRPASMYVTLLADRELLKKRVKGHTGWETGNDTSYTRLTGDNGEWCPQGLMGAQFDRYTTREYYVLCTEENLEEIVKEKGEPPRSLVLDRRLRRF
jgi:hypothetical protein